MEIIQQQSAAGLSNKDEARIDQINSDEMSSTRSGTDLAGMNCVLPPVPKRWVPHRKAEIVTAVRGGSIALDEVCKRYALSVEEYLSWERAIELFGLAGLCASNAQQRRQGRVRSADHLYETGLAGYSGMPPVSSISRARLPYTPQCTNKPRRARNSRQGVVLLVET